MPCYKILGIYSYADNLREITSSEQVILKHEKYNIKSKNAIGVYTKKTNKKIGYLPTENNNELLNFNNSYIISKLQLNQDYPIVEISRSYPNINIINNYELTLIKKIKYDYQIIDHPSNLKIPLTTLINTLKRNRINVKRLAITYLDDNYINIIIETSKGLESFYTVTSNYFKENQDKYNELYEYNLIDNIFFKELLFHRPEKYFEINYKNILDYDIQTNNDNQSIHNNQYEFIKIDSVNSINSSNDDIDILYFTKLYLYCIINQNYEYVIKYLNKFTKNKYDNIINKLINNYIVIDNIYITYNLKLGNFYYDHDKKIYSEIEFVNDDIIFIVSEKLNNKYLLNCYLTNINKIIVYNPLLGTLHESLLNS